MSKEKRFENLAVWKPSSKLEVEMWLLKKPLQEFQKNEVIKELQIPWIKQKKNLGQGHASRWY